MIEIVGVPFDLCGKHHGSRLGPLAMLIEGLVPGLERLGHRVTVGDVLAVAGRTPANFQDQTAQAMRAYEATKARVSALIGSETLPVVLGGDHSLSIGSIAGALDVFREGLAVLWIDAHMDLNTPDTTPSGRLHGMPLGALSHLSPVDALIDEDPRGKPWLQPLFELWPQVLELVGETRLAGNRMGWVGLRDVDPGEVRNLRRLEDAFVRTMQDVDSDGILGVMQAVDRWLRETEAKSLWISFDVDVFDPDIAPGTGTAVRGGLTYREGHLVAETLCAYLNDPFCPYSLAGVDVVEVNPLRDTHNETARVANEWLFSLFGKTILHPVDPGRTEL
ncbi:MAG: arginase [Fimbriimonadaceae bacterium]|nr:arginase [Fimbriimonadaceae bacterium]QYK55846.1 MAG: arginase [Fimbriimonadaceae bacterium]